MLQGALAVVGLFGVGWAAHAFFHRREHDKLKSQVSELEEKVSNGLDIRVNIQEVTAQSLEKDNKINWLENELKRVTTVEPATELNDEQADVLLAVHKGKTHLSPAANRHGDRYSLITDQLKQMGLLARGVEGPYCTEKGRQLLDELGLI